MEPLGAGSVRLRKADATKAVIEGLVQGQSLLLGYMNPYRYEKEGATWFNEYVEGFIELSLGVSHTDADKYAAALTLLRAAVESCLPERLRPSNIPSQIFSCPDRLPDFYYAGWRFVSEELQHDDGYDVWMFSAVDDARGEWSRVFEIRLYKNGNVALEPSDNHNQWPCSGFGKDFHDAWIQQVKETLKAISQ